MTDEPTRRTFLTTATAVAGAVGLSGCSAFTGSSSPPTRTPNQQRIDRLETRVSKLETAIKDKNNRIRSLRTKVDETEQELAELNQTLDERNSRIEDLQQRIDELQAEIGIDFTDEQRQKARELGQEVSQSVVFVEGDSSTAAGWLHRSGVIVTTAHSVSVDEEYTCHTVGGDDIPTTAAHAVNPPDVAILEPDTEPGISPLYLADSYRNVGFDAPIIQVGHPAGLEAWTISAGRFESHDPTGGVIKCNIPGRIGNSGGPIVTLEGDFIGMSSRLNFGSIPAPDTPQQTPEVYERYPESGGTVVGVDIQTLKDEIDHWNSHHN